MTATATPLLGSSINRVDGAAKVRGDAKYSVDDARPEMTWGYLVTSDVAAGHLTEVDTDDAREAAGVVAIFTPFHPLPIKPLPSVTNPTGSRYAPLMDGVIHHYGQVVAFVVAETYEQARYAATLVRAVYRDGPVAVDLAGGLDTVPDSVAHGQDADLGFAPKGRDLNEVFARSDVVVTGTYRTCAQNHSALEPHSALAWWTDDERLHVRTGHQAIPWLVAELAGAFDVDGADIDVVSTYIGGAFGGKTRAGVDVKLACAAARVLRRPVKTVMTRKQVFTATVIRAMTEQEVTLGARRDGRLTTVKHRSRSAESALISDLLIAPGHVTSRMLYQTEAMSIGQRRVTLNLPRTGYMRGPSEVPGLFALETAMDELADRLGMDPVELRQRNNAAVFPGLGIPWSSKHLDECLEVGVERFGWADRFQKPASRRDGDDYVGMGMAVTAYQAGQPAPVAVSATLRDDGSVEVATSAADLGTGMVTVIAMSAADALQVPIRCVSVRHGDSALPAGGAALGSTGTASVAPAVLSAVRAAMTELRAYAVADPTSPMHGQAVDDITVQGGRLVSDHSATEFADVLRSAGRPALTGFGHTQPKGPIDSGRAHWSFGAQFSEVRINRWTREPRVSRMLSVMDIGRVVNVKTAKSQIMGSMIWGLSAALFEGLEFDPRGVMTNANLADYLVPVNADTPEIDVVLLDIPDYSHNVLGVRGAGEIAVGGMTAAIGNAIYNAVGIRLRALPMTLDDLLEDTAALL